MFLKLWNGFGWWVFTTAHIFGLVKLSSVIRAAGFRVSSLNFVVVCYCFEAYEWFDFVGN